MKKPAGLKLEVKRALGKRVAYRGAPGVSVPLEFGGAGLRIPGRIRTGVIGRAWRVQDELRRRAMTAAELAAASGLSLRDLYRLLGAMKDANLPVEVVPTPTREPGKGRPPVVYRLRARA